MMFRSKSNKISRVKYNLVRSPYSNTGVERTEKKNRIICDWLEFTGLTDLQEINDAKDKIYEYGINLKKFKALNSGLFGYKNRLFFNGQSILYNGNYGMRVHFIMSGKGVRFYELDNNSSEFIKKLVFEEKDTNFTRIDLAMDIMDESINFKTMLDYLTNNYVVTRFKQYKYIVEKEIQDDGQKTTGESIYFGSRTSDLYIRIYDKAKEREEFDANWIRIEIVFKRERANALAYYIADGKRCAGDLFSSVLNNYLRFVEPPKKGNDTNKRRWKMTPWWEQLLYNLQTIKLSMQGEEPDIEKLESWINKQVAPSLAVIKEYYKGDMKKIEEIIINGVDRINPKYEKILESIKEGD